MAEDNVLRFRMDGVEYALRGAMSEERLREIVRITEEKVCAIRQASPNYSAVKVSTLAALQLAEELLDAREEGAAVLAEANIGGQYSYNFSLPPRK